jgi:hypothetical protein
MVYLVGHFVKNVKVKIIMAGEPGAGKSFIAKAADVCVPARKIGVSIGKVSEAFEEASVEMTLLTWTISWGQPKQKTHFKQAEAAIIVSDITKPETVKMAPLWADRINDLAGNIPLFFAAINPYLEYWEDFAWLLDIAKKYDSSCFQINRQDLSSARALFRAIAQSLAEDFVRRKKEDQKQIMTLELT